MQLAVLPRPPVVDVLSFGNDLSPPPPGQSPSDGGYAYADRPSHTPLGARYDEVVQQQTPDAPPQPVDVPHEQQNDVAPVDVSSVHHPCAVVFLRLLRAGNAPGNPRHISTRATY